MTPLALRRWQIVKKPISVVVNSPKKLCCLKEPYANFARVLLRLSRILIVVHGANDAGGFWRRSHDLEYIRHAESVLIGEIDIDGGLCTTEDLESKIIDCVNLQYEVTSRKALRKKSSVLGAWTLFMVPKLGHAYPLLLG
ncbi:hypothetical protein [Streptacidiphilus sp. P02-A3a]|uniref:hypothetical protein n=1 Tax=Streptacidiphilus sp. P02-A3a TaxID=2704468 RepID=UPI0015FB6764|nr:hypothetical protein [Streptacidiphilus sp. P02-A3a]QMU69083.1 hypothetical protein GXP74_13350 [Streptacidiphilus sp. P02-A3a]